MAVAEMFGDEAEAPAFVVPPEGASEGTDT